MNEQKNWAIQLPWNHAMSGNRKDRKVEPRNILFASEIGKPFLEVFWAMKGILPTNPPSDVALRKMEAGNTYEAIVVWTLKRVGILRDTQTRVRLLNDSRFLPVYGRLDLIAGHDGNWEKSRKEMDEYFAKTNELMKEFPLFEEAKRTSYEILEFLSSQYPTGLSDKIYEVKSVNSMKFWHDEKPITEASSAHIKQLTFYQTFNDVGLDDGSFLYIDRDTRSISEIPNIPNEKVKKETLKWLEKMTEYYNNDITPEPPELIIWDVKNKRYTVNWEIMYSSYKDKLLEGKTKEDLAELVNAKNKEMRKQKKLKEKNAKKETLE